MATDIGAKIKLEGGAEFERSLKNITTASKQLASELKLVESQFSKNGTSTQALTAKSGVLTRQIDVQNQRITQLSSKVSEAQTKLDSLGREASEAAKKFGENSIEAQKAAVAYDKQAGNVDRLKTQLNNAKIALNSMKNQLSEVQRQQNPFVQLSSKLDDFSRKVESVSGKLKGLTDFGDKLTNKLTKPAIAAAGALGGLTIAKGWQRLTAIDDAKVKLEALGNSAEDVSVIMDNALTSVKGTAYSLDEAATTAASAVASGIKPGKQLEGYLRTVADTAAVAGTSMADMGSIFNKVAAKGKVDAEILNQLSDAGVPALQLLADQLGVTTEKVSEMVSAGEIDFATFQEAMKKGVDGAAVMMGTKTVTGAISNIGASLSRIGSNFLDAGGKGEGFLRK